RPPGGRPVAGGAAAAGPGRGATRRAGGADPRRTGERAGPGRRALAARLPAPVRRGGSHRAGFESHPGRGGTGCRPGRADRSRPSHLGGPGDRADSRREASGRGAHASRGLAWCRAEIRGRCGAGHRAGPAGHHRAGHRAGGHAGCSSRHPDLRHNHEHGESGGGLPAADRSGRQARMTAALHAEFLKLGTTRLVAAMTGLAVALTALIGVLEAVTAGTGKGMAIPSLATAGGLRDNLASTGFALLAAALLGVVITSGEFRLKTATDTYLDQPDRGRVLAAKAIAAAAAGAVLGTAAAAAATAIALGFAASRGYPIALSDPAIARYTAGAVVGSALLAATGVGAGSLIRHQVGATIAVVAWALVIELVVGATLTTVGRFLPYTAASMMAGDTNGGGMPQIP